MRMARGSMSGLLLVLGGVLAASASSGASVIPAPPPGPVGGYTVGPPSTGATAVAHSVFKVPGLSCPAASAPIMAGVSVWDGNAWTAGGGNAVGAVVTMSCVVGPIVAKPVPVYTAEGFYFSSSTGRTTVTSFGPVGAGQTMAVTATVRAKGGGSEAVVADRTTSTTWSHLYGPVGLGTSIVGMFCTTDWPAPTPCAAVPVFKKVMFSGTTVDGTALGSLPYAAWRLTGPGFTVPPGPLTTSGKGFTDTYL